MKRLVAIIGFGLGASLLALSLLALSLASGWPPGVLRVSLEWVATRLIDEEVSIGRLSGSPLDSLTIEDLVIGPPSDPSLRLALLHVELGELDLGERTIGLDAVRLAGAQLEGRRREDGLFEFALVEGARLGPSRIELESSTQTDALADPWTVEIDTISLEEFRLVLDWKTSTVPGHLVGTLDATTHDFRWPLPGDELAWPSRFEAGLVVESASIEGRAIRSGQLTLRLRDGALSADLSDLSSDGGRIATAHFDAELSGSPESPQLRTGSATLSLFDVDLHTWIHEAAPRSAIDGELQLAWNDQAWRDFLIEGSLSMASSTIAGIVLDAGGFRGHLRRDADTGIHYALEDLRLGSRFGAASGRIEGHGEEVDVIDINSAQVELAALPAEWGGAGFSAGQGTVAGSLSGPWNALRGPLDVALSGARREDVGAFSAKSHLVLQAPDGLRFDTLEIDDTDFGGESIEALSPFRLSWADGDVSVEKASLGALGGEIHLTGGVADGRLRLPMIEIRDLDAARIAPLLQPDLAEQGVSGRIDADLAINGAPQAPRIAGEVVWRSPALGALTLDRASLRLEPLEGERLESRLSLMREGSEVLFVRADTTARGLFTEPQRLLDAPRSKLELTLRHLDAGWIAPLLPDDAPAPTGTIEGTARVTGPLRAPGIEARLDWSDAAWRGWLADRVGLRAASPRNDASVDFDLVIEREGRVVVKAHMELADGALLAEPRSLLERPTTAVDLEVDDLDLGWMRPAGLDGELQVAGRLAGKLRLNGGQIPQATGQLSLDGLLLSGHPLPGEIGPTSGTIELLGTALHIDGLSLESGQGAMLISADVSWADPDAPEARVNARLERFAIVQPGVIEAQLEGVLEAVGRPSTLRAEGEVVLHHARIDLPEQQDPLMREIRVQQLPGKDDRSVFDESAPGALGAVEGEIVFQIGESVWLRGIGAELEVVGQLIARKEKGKPPGLYGNVEVVGGRVDFQGKWLRVTRGLAVFDGNPDPNPYLDATAMHRVRDVEIRVRLFGRASDLVLELESDPPLSREDQLSYLLFDRPVTEISDANQRGIGATAGALAGDLVLGQVGNEIAREVGLDRVRLGLDKDQAPTLEVEKRLHERVVARYGRSFGEGGGDTFAVEWQLFRRFFLSGDQTTSGSSGLDVFWRIDY